MARWRSLRMSLHRAVSSTMWRAKFGGVGVEQDCDVAAGRAAALADGDELPDLGEGQSGGCATLMRHWRLATRPAM